MQDDRISLKFYPKKGKYYTSHKKYIDNLI